MSNYTVYANGQVFRPQPPEYQTSLPSPGAYAQAQRLAHLQPAPRDAHGMTLPPPGPGRHSAVVPAVHPVSAGGTDVRFGRAFFRSQAEADLVRAAERPDDLDRRLFHEIVDRAREATAAVDNYTSRMQAVAAAATK